MTGLDARVIALSPVSASSETRTSRSSEEASLLASSHVEQVPKCQDGENTDSAPKRAWRDWTLPSPESLDIETGGDGRSEEDESVGHLNSFQCIRC